MKILAWYFIILIALGGGAVAEEKDLDAMVVRLNMIEATDGYCEKIVNNPIVPSEVKRYFSLAAMEDLIIFLKAGKSITHDWVGNLNSFKIGRKLNPDFLVFYGYSSREDVRRILDKDRYDFKPEEDFINKYLEGDSKESKAFSEESKAFSEHIKSILQSYKAPMGVRTKEEAEDELYKLIVDPTLCYIHGVVMDENSDSAAEFRDYANSVIQRAMHKNIEKVMEYAE